MAKSSTFFGLRRGSTKTLTFQVNNGQQITKDRVTDVKNPQTEAQMIQRFVMNTVIRAYSQFQELCDHSFENIQVGMDSMKNFISLNCGALRARVAAAIDNGEDLYGLYAFTPKGEKYLVPNAYVISRGSLPEVTTTIPALLGCVPLGAGAANTYEGVIDALGLQRGDQLTFVTIEGNGPTRIAMRYARVILDPQNADGSEASLSSPFVGADNKINLPNVRNEGNFLGLTFADSSINFKFTNQGVGAAGVIVSRKVGEVWKRSNCQLVIKESTIAGFFPSLGECLDMVGQSDIATRNALYLNNAGRGRVASSAMGGHSVGLYQRTVSYVDPETQQQAQRTFVVNELGQIVFTAAGNDPDALTAQYLFMPVRTEEDGLYTERKNALQVTGLYAMIAAAGGTAELDFTWKQPNNVDIQVSYGGTTYVFTEGTQSECWINPNLPVW